MRRLFTRLRRRRPESTSCMQSVQNAPVIREQHRIVSEKLHEVTTRIANVQRRVPQDADAGEFLEASDAACQREKLAIKDFHPEKPETKNGYAEMQVTLKGARQLWQHLHVCRPTHQIDAALQNQGSDAIGWRRRDRVSDDSNSRDLFRVTGQRRGVGPGGTQWLTLKRHSNEAA